MIIGFFLQRVYDEDVSQEEVTQEEKKPEEQVGALYCK